MKDFDPKRLSCFTAYLLASFLAFAWLESAVTRKANLLNQAKLTLPNNHGMPKILHSFPNLADKWMKNTASTGTAQVWLLGTSISLLGFNPCSNPNTANYSRSAAYYGDMLFWATEAASKNDAVNTMVIEVSLAKKPTPRAESPDMRSRVFFMSMIELLSKRTYHSAQTDGGSCASPFSLENRIIRPILIPESEILRNRGLDFFDRSNALGDWCSESSDRHLIFFLPPYNPKVVSQQKLKPTLDRLQEKLKVQAKIFQQRHPTCRISFHVAEASPSDSAAWIDANHFRPSLGNRLLEELLSLR